MKKFIWISLAVLLVLALCLGATYLIVLRARSLATGEEVIIQPVVRGELVEFIQAPGELEPRNKVSISAKISSRVLELPFAEGEQVKRGDVLVKLDDTDLRASLRSAEAHFEAQKAGISAAEARLAAEAAQIEGARATLADAQRDLARQVGLLASKDVSQSVADQAQRRLDEQSAALKAAISNQKADEANLVASRHNLEAADADIARAREELAYTTIVSPIDGVVTTINTKVGEMCITGTMNNPGTVLLEVADLAQMLLVARVDESDIGNVEVGQSARVQIQAYADRVFEGTVNSVALVRFGDRGSSVPAQAGARSYKVGVLLKPAKERLRSGLSAEVEVQTRRYQDVLKVPTQAVLGRPVEEIPQAARDAGPPIDQRKTTTTVVYRYSNGEASITPVEVGASDLTHTIIKAGLHEGDRIITGPFKALDKLSHEKKVREQAGPATRPTTLPATMPTTQGMAE